MHSNEVQGSLPNSTPEHQASVRNERHSSAWRFDIQVLRGLAVAWVVADHLHVPFVGAGYLGVDIFFVISGFLMTGLIARGIDESTFSLGGFYARRIRRLLPACYATVGATVLLSVLLLDSFELRNLSYQVVGAFTFTTNMVLWKQVDYFNSLADLKPLLHLWSLAVEEQYYLLLPAALLICPRRHFLSGTLVLTAISFALCLYFAQRSPSAAFYFLPFRAWELGIGSAGALFVLRRGPVMRNALALRILCAGLLLVLPAWGGTSGHPGWLALVVCLATLAILVTGDTNRPSALAPIAWLGDRSYSLYLVHWPLIALAYNVHIDSPPTSVMVSLVALIVVCTELQYRFVETPFRRIKMSAATIGVLMLFPLCTAATVLFFTYAKDTDIQLNREANAGFSRDCDARGNYLPLALCENQHNPKTLVWGDSFAMHLVPALDASMQGGIAQATRSVCGPLIGLAPLDDGLRKRPWAEQCIRFNDSVFEYLKANPTIETVVLSTVLKQYLPGAEPSMHWRFLAKTASGFAEVDQDADVSRRALELTFEALRRIGKKVVLIAPPPSANFDIGRCLSRERAKLLTMGREGNCEISMADYRPSRLPVLQFLADLERLPSISLITFDTTLCNETSCKTKLSGTPLYSDAAHLSVAGSRALGSRMRLGDRIEQVAR